jgi:hypothetical protein
MSGGSRFTKLDLDKHLVLKTVDTHISARCAISDDLSSSLKRSSASRSMSVAFFLSDLETYRWRQNNISSVRGV